MKIFEMVDRHAYYTLVKNAAPGSFIALTDRGWLECRRLFLRDMANSGTEELPEQIMGLPVVQVRDIAHDEIEVRATVRGASCTVCGRPVYLHKPTMVWGCTSPACATTGTVETHPNQSAFHGW